MQTNIFFNDVQYEIIPEDKLNKNNFSTNLLNDASSVVKW